MFIAVVGEQVLVNFSTKIIATIFGFNGSGRLGGERNIHQGGGRRSMIGRGVGGVKITPAEVIVILQNSVRPRTEFLMAAVKFQLSIKSQMCHLDILLLGKNAKDGKLCK